MRNCCLLVFAIFGGCAVEPQTDKLDPELDHFIQLGLLDIRIEVEAERVHHLKPEHFAAAEKYICANPNSSSYHLLFALKRDAPARYNSLSNELKATILFSAFAKTTIVSDWGALETSVAEGGSICDSEIACALVETGMSALSYLEPILNDKTAVGLRGSAPACTSMQDKYRRCDYAYRFCCHILRIPYVYDRDPGVRDGRIAKLRRLLRELKEV